MIVDILSVTQAVEERILGEAATRLSSLVTLLPDYQRIPLGVMVSVLGRFELECSPRM